MAYASARRVRKFSQGSQVVASGRKMSQAVGPPTPPIGGIFSADLWNPKYMSHV